MFSVQILYDACECMCDWNNTIHQWFIFVNISIRQKVLAYICTVATIAITLVLNKAICSKIICKGYEQGNLDIYEICQILSFAHKLFLHNVTNDPVSFVVHMVLNDIYIYIIMLMSLKTTSTDSCGFQRTVYFQLYDIFYSR